MEVCAISRSESAASMSTEAIGDNKPPPSVIQSLDVNSFSPFPFFRKIVISPIVPII